MRHACKDPVSGAELGARHALPMPVLATATCQTALLQAHGMRDKGGMICVYEELPGARFRGRDHACGSDHARGTGGQAIKAREDRP